LVEFIRHLSDVPIGVAAFPYGHPSAESLQHDAAVLAMKQQAGADFALTQVLFEPEAYFRLIDRASARGATLPVIAGIMPITGSVRLEKLQLLSGAPLPERLAEQVASARDGDELARIGVEWCVDLVRKLLDGGAPGIHFYTLNASVATETICRELSLRGRANGTII
jgi:methylenetetrahydrofolate reductase (NADPH)